MSEGLEKLALIQKVFEKLADWNAYDLAKLDKDYETNFDLDFLEIEKALKEHEQYKTVEQKLGIDLVTKNKVEQSNEVYVEGLGIAEIMNYYRTGISLDKYDASGNQMFLRYKDYGKTWALTREELE